MSKTSFLLLLSNLGLFFSDVSRVSNNPFVANFKEPQQQQQQQPPSSTTAAAANVGCGDLTKNPFSSSFIPPPGKSNEVKTSSRMVGLNDCILRQHPQKISFYNIASEASFIFIFYLNFYAKNYFVIFLLFTIQTLLQIQEKWIFYVKMSTFQIFEFSRRKYITTKH